MKRMSPIARRYMARMIAALALYMISLFGAVYLIETRHVSGPLAWALALVPGLATVGMFYAFGMFIVEQKDEFIRMLLVRQNMIATGLAMSVACVWGFLEQFHLVEHVEAYYIVVLWAIGLQIGAVSNRITHGSWGSCW